MNDDPQAWVSWPHMIGWAVIFAVMLVYELYTLWWNRKNKGRRANLTAFVMAFFGTSNRRLKYRAGSAVLIAVFVFFLGHFMGWW
jgi:hypothetical protein